MGETIELSTESSSTAQPKRPQLMLRRNSLNKSLRRNSLNSADDLSVISDLDGKVGSVLDDEAREVRGLARKETFKVQILRLIVAICILGSGIIVSLYTYRVLEEEEKRDSHESVRLICLFGISLLIYLCEHAV